MKILIYGAGVIGCTYGWQLSLAGNDITVLVKPGKKEIYQEQGIRIRCSDFRTGVRQITETVFYPQVVDKLDGRNDFEYIIVAVGSHHLHEILPVLSQSAGKAHILFFQNLWFREIEEITRHLSSTQYFFGFPFMAGGGKNGNSIEAIISGSKYSKTMLGEIDGATSDRANRIASEMEKAGMKPFISGQIINWLIPHFAFIAAISAGAIKAGGTIRNLLMDKQVLKDSVKAIREGFSICEKKGINPKKEKVNQLYYLPFFICLPIMKKIFGNEDMSMMFDKYLGQSADEVREMLKVIMDDAEPNKMPYLEDLYKHLF